MHLFEMLEELHCPMTDKENHTRWTLRLLPRVMGHRIDRAKALFKQMQVSPRLYEGFNSERRGAEGEELKKDGLRESRPPEQSHAVCRRLLCVSC